MGVKQSKKIFNEVKNRVAGFESEFEKMGIPDMEIERLSLDINKRLEKA